MIKQILLQIAIVYKIQLILVSKDIMEMELHIVIVNIHV